MKKFFADFKKFLTRGNVVDLAIGIIIGSAFTAIVTSVVNDIFMPLISAITGKSLNSWVWVVNGVSQYLADGVTINPEAIILHYGNLIQAVINFLIVGLVLFLIVKAMMSAKGFNENALLGYTKQEYRAFKKEGKKRADIEAMAKARDEEAAAKKKAEEEEAKKHSTEVLLEEIKEILKAQSAK